MSVVLRRLRRLSLAQDFANNVMTGVLITGIVELLMYGFVVDMIACKTTLLGCHYLDPDQRVVYFAVNKHQFRGFDTHRSIVLFHRKP